MIMSTRMLMGIGTASRGGYGYEVILYPYWEGVWVWGIFSIVGMGVVLCAHQVSYPLSSLPAMSISN